MHHPNPHQEGTPSKTHYYGLQHNASKVLLAFNAMMDNTLPQAKRRGMELKVDLNRHQKSKSLRDDSRLGELASL